MTDATEAPLDVSTTVGKGACPLQSQRGNEGGFEQNNWNNEIGFDEILTQLIEKIDKPSIKNSLKHSLIINRITNETVYIITISKVAQLLFNNTENMRYIEEKLAEVMGERMSINVVFENKESYFARKLE